MASKDSSSPVKATAEARHSGVKENQQNPAAIESVRIDAPNPVLPEVDEDLERQKARGQTESQKQERAFFEGRFQTHEATADKKRDKGDSVGPA